ncbi:outer membrane porin, OprD family, partial [Pseudomonas sp. Pseusp122]
MTTPSTRSLVLLGASSLAMFLPILSQAEGFIEDSKATLTLRNAYFNRNFT